ncbi:pseudouridine synthase [Adhaeribacter radiodurans]|uniref:Pseudouridine synthase n=1 Tax=Adhaeribacter radiodurans TaxID=2745197 RepID=A0A7L7LE93_9BACT|nr:pseudouridine synthase [Adhaeribacter radiodurans]QMU31158.1 pseudouridine synthase [Adhaeribacter radiodurans]
MATESNSTGSGKFNSRNKFTKRSSNDSDNKSWSKGKSPRFNNEGKKVFNRSNRFDRSSPSTDGNRENNQNQEPGSFRENRNNQEGSNYRRNGDNKRFGGFQSNNKFKNSKPFTSRNSFSKEGDGAPKRYQRSDESGESNRESDYRPARPYNPNRNFNTENRYRKSPFGDVPKGKPGERNRSFKPEKEAYRQKLQSEGNSHEDRFGNERRPFNRDKEEGNSTRKPFNRFNQEASNDDRRPFDRNGSTDRKPYGGSREETGARKPFNRNRDEATGERKSFNRTRDNKNQEHAPFQRSREETRPDRDKFVKKPFNKRDSGRDEPRSFRRNTEERPNEAPDYDLRRFSQRDSNKSGDGNHADGGIRLNRYIANAGVCSRREADTLIAAGEIKVNGEVVIEMGYMVKPEDTVQYGKKRLNREKMVYVLLNKPKDFITTTEDPEGRKTVMNLVENASKERIFPVGRLDRNTTGLLLFTNDGELAQKLTHPSHENSKIYQVELDKPITREDFVKIEAGLELEDGKAEVDELALVGDTGKFLGIKIHIGKNRIVRRIFEHLGYEVVSLDRVQYAGLTKKDLPRGKWRFLSEKEVIRLKYFL